MGGAHRQRAPGLHGPAPQPAQHSHVRGVGGARAAGVRPAGRRSGGGAGEAAAFPLPGGVPRGEGAALRPHRQRARRPGGGRAGEHPEPAGLPRGGAGGSGLRRVGLHAAAGVGQEQGAELRHRVAAGHAAAAQVPQCGVGYVRRHLEGGEPAPQGGAGERAGI